MRKISVLNVITFLSAFLLFQIELIISKFLLPYFGGSYLVWGACVVFFQATLFLGYFFSYVFLQKIGIRRLLPVYLILYLLPLLVFPGKALPAVGHFNFPLVISVFWQLVLLIGAVFFVLSTSSVILQSWLASSELSERKNPYTLYAVSNFGSFAALISYPFFFEFFLSLDQQLLFWRIIYFLLAGLVIYAVWTIKVNTENKPSKLWDRQGILWQDILQWLLFSCAGVIMFLSVTNILTYEIAPVPLLWVIPLCIYLISFVLNFKRSSWSPAWVEDKFYLTFAWSIILFFITIMRILPLAIGILAICWFLFHSCMFCQRRLYKLKPVNLTGLALFYLVVALGGFLGGVVATWLMPLFSVVVSEYLLGLVVIALALVFGAKPQKIGWLNTVFIILVCFTLIVWPVLFKKYNFFGIIILLLVFKICFQRLIKNPPAILLSILLIFIFAPRMCSFWDNSQELFSHRNYYGIYRVFDQGDKIVLMNGTTMHGFQFKDKNKEKLPLAYYHRLTPIGDYLSSEKVGANIGLIGLGTGALSAYMNDRQEADFFEIDPDMYFIARNLFTHLKYSSGKVNFIFGDARLSIQAAPLKRYDLLVVDAFSGDAIPVHLLTVEAIKEYRRHLKDNGIIFFHTSNRYLNLSPVLFSNANDLDAWAVYKNNPEDVPAGLCRTSWFALTWDRGSFDKLVDKFAWHKWLPGKNKLIRPWTDRYSNVLMILDLNNFLNSLKDFRPFYW
ncbi:MAG: fused MFS/spermidine synthase [Candidatus Omnitrophota bacterium]